MISLVAAARTWKDVNFQRTKKTVRKKSRSDIARHHVRSDKKISNFKDSAPCIHLSLQICFARIVGHFCGCNGLQSLGIPPLLQLKNCSGKQMHFRGLQIWPFPAQCPSQKRWFLSLAIAGPLPESRVQTVGCHGLETRRSYVAPQGCVSVRFTVRR